VAGNCGVGSACWIRHSSVARGPGTRRSVRGGKVGEGMNETERGESDGGK